MEFPGLDFECPSDLGNPGGPTIYETVDGELNLFLSQKSQLLDGGLYSTLPNLIKTATSSNRTSVKNKIRDSKPYLSEESAIELIKRKSFFGHTFTINTMKDNAFVLLMPNARAEALNKDINVQSILNNWEQGARG